MKVTSKHVQSLVRRWAPRLGLEHWTITVIIGETSDDALLEITRHQNAHRAVIRISTLFAEAQAEGVLETVDADYVEQMVVHELCHLHFRDIRFAVDEYMSENAAPGERVVLDQTLFRAEEQSVDLLATSLTRAWRGRIRGS